MVGTRRSKYLNPQLTPESLSVPKLSSRIGNGKTHRPASRMLYKIADWLVIAGLRTADTTVAIGHDMATLFSGLGIAQRRIKVITVWSNLNTPTPKKSRLLGDQRPETYSVLYAGHLGSWHDYQTIASVIPNFANEDILFRFAAVGAGIENIRKEIAQNRACNIAFESRVVSTDVRSLLTLLMSADAHLITLHNFAIGTCVPSKLYAAMAVARPVIFVGPSGSQAAMDVRAAGAGFVVAPGDSGGLERVIRKLATDRNGSLRLGLQGYEWFRRNRSREVAINAWAQLLSETASCAQRQTAHGANSMAVQTQ